MPFRVTRLELVERKDGALEEAATEAMRSRLEGARVELIDARRNARGELEGGLRLGDGRLVRELLLERGFALLGAEAHEGPHAARLRSAQERARVGGAGVWGLPRVPAERADAIRGRIARVCGNAGAVLPGRDGGWRIHLGSSHLRHELTLRIPEARSAAFGPADERYERHDLCAVGRVEPARDGPELRVADPGQIEDRGGFRAR